MSETDCFNNYIETTACGTERSGAWGKDKWKKDGNRIRDNVLFLVQKKNSESYSQTET